ncbi:hypothetical protein [Nocardia abscessus]|uniref:hypothetical protein n=1 Tax=Nocardia abscessus TaxID=120957 RepID=UPI001E52F2DA|nr:hypothetical protein [Nocardia abscessus]
MRELHPPRLTAGMAGTRGDPVLRDARDALVRPFVAGRCDGDTLPIHRHVSRAMQIGMRAGLVDPVVASICGPVPFSASPVRRTGFPAEQVTTLLADWENAPAAYTAHTTKLVLHRPPVTVG